MLRTHDLTFRYGPRTLWSDLHLRVEPRSMHALVGPSGSGKSTLLNCLGMLASPTSGTIEFDGVELTSLGREAARKFRRDRLGYLFQNYALVEDGTVRDNLAVVRTRRRGRDRRADMRAALDQVGVGGARLDDRVAWLSGGEQQRVALARLLLKEPDLVLADEPTGAVDHDNTVAIVGHLRDLAYAGACVMVATHNPVVRDACDAITVLNSATAPDPAPERS